MNVQTIFKPEVKKILDIALKQILSVGEPSKVFLFGSYARGEEAEDSDIDFYIIENISNYKERNVSKYYKALFSLNHAKDIIVRSLEEFEKNKEILNTLEYDIYKEGFLLYERK